MTHITPEQAREDYELLALSAQLDSCIVDPKWAKRYLLFIQQYEQMEARETIIMKCVADRKAVYAEKRDAANPFGEDMFTRCENFQSMFEAMEWLEGEISRAVKLCAAAATKGE